MIFVLLLLLGGLALLLWLFRVFTTRIISAECFIAALIAWLLLRHAVGLHTVFCIIISIGVFAGMRMLFHTKPGFVIFSSIASFAWASMFAAIAHSATGGDMIWVWFIGITSFGAVMFFHLMQRTMDFQAMRGLNRPESRGGAPFKLREKDDI